MARLKWLRAQWDRTLATVAVAAGLICVLLGWIGAKDTAYPAEQIPYVISGAVFGVLLVGLGATAWLSADLRDEWRKLDRVEEILLAVATDDSHPEPSIDGSEPIPSREPALHDPATR